MEIGCCQVRGSRCEVKKCSWWTPVGWQSINEQKLLHDLKASGHNVGHQCQKERSVKPKKIGKKKKPQLQVAREKGGIFLCSQWSRVWWPRAQRKENIGNQKRISYVLHTFSSQKRVESKERWFRTRRGTSCKRVQFIITLKQWLRDKDLVFKKEAVNTKIISQTAALFPRLIATLLPRQFPSRKRRQFLMQEAAVDKNNGKSCENFQLGMKRKNKNKAAVIQEAKNAGNISFLGSLRSLSSQTFWVRQEVSEKQRTRRVKRRCCPRRLPALRRMYRARCFSVTHDGSESLGRYFQMTRMLRTSKLLVHIHKWSEKTLSNCWMWLKKIVLSYG